MKKRERAIARVGLCRKSRRCYESKMPSKPTTLSPMWVPGHTYINKCSVSLSMMLKATQLHDMDRDGQHQEYNTADSLF